MTHPLQDLVRAQSSGHPVGITSVCSAHPLVIEATLRHGKGSGRPVLIEATCNQVNQEGGYTGMTPRDFRALVERIAEDVGYDGQIILGGDHLGPNPWKDLPVEDAMCKAEAMIVAYAEAGFTKLHLDTSMGCAGEPLALDDATTAERAARLASAAERAAGDVLPVYIVGTEVPVPGGALEALDHMVVTAREAALATIEVHRMAFAARGLEDAFFRVVGLVVQPGVEFGNAEVIVYDRSKAIALSDALKGRDQFVYEAHSTDYQPVAALKALVEDRFAILKVGPGLTFALREALYALDAIAGILDGGAPGTALWQAMETAMTERPGHWRKYYHGTEDDLRFQRHFSYSDRIRYYWPEEDVRTAVDALLSRLGDREIPAPLVSQYLARVYPKVADGDIPATASALLIAAVTAVLEDYERACVPSR